MTPQSTLEWSRFVEPMNRVENCASRFAPALGPLLHSLFIGTEV